MEAVLAEIMFPGIDLGRHVQGIRVAFEYLPRDPVEGRRAQAERESEWLGRQGKKRHRRQSCERPAFPRPG